MSTWEFFDHPVHWRFEKRRVKALNRNVRIFKICVRELPRSPGLHPRIIGIRSQCITACHAMI